MPRKKLDQVFEVKFERDGSGWLATIPRVPGCITWGRSIEEARRNIREALATCEDVLGDRVEEIAERARFEENFDLPRGTKEALNVLRVKEAHQKQIQADADRAQADVERARELAARKLGSVSSRDAGLLLGVSHERARQIVMMVKSSPQRAATASSGKLSVKASARSTKAPHKRRAG
ncbi:MAG TPA: type II toxin-antitoxin system HicB family antitoxin [Polyangiaceae bacterium]